MPLNLFRTQEWVQHKVIVFIFRAGVENKTNYSEYMRAQTKGLPLPVAGKGELVREAIAPCAIFPWRGVLPIRRRSSQSDE